MPHETSDLQQHLMQALQFNEADLQANRAEQMSQEQYVRLFTRQKRLVRSMQVLLGGSALTIMGLIIADRSPTYMNLELLLVYFLIGILVSTPLVYQDFSQIKADLRARTVKHITGDLTYSRPVRRKNIVIFFNSRAGLSVSINRIYFWLPEEICRQLAQNQLLLTIYYTPFSKTVLSAEVSSKNF